MYCAFTILFLLSAGSSALSVSDHHYGMAVLTGLLAIYWAMKITREN